MTDDDVYFDIPVQINNKFEKRISEVFRVFDHRAINMVNGEDIGSILRFLGCVPTEEQIQTIIKNTEFPSHPGDIHLSNFLPYIKDLLIRHEMKPSKPEALLQAFKILDPKDKGFIEKEIFESFIKDCGEAMSEETYKEMMKTAVDPIEKKVYYEPYIRKLMHEPEDSIYKLADAYIATTEGSRASMRRKTFLSK
ncbi:CLUMA_CG019114, isoform A [Clunio marinus]|uniref:CLUMA_CG019114, isoform A n=1 Tax=Clunio marinus TaxID=568069 RepID=A0A1J1J1U5_9DIPT|nr:CLUMA_CG019114, isoform A [Clunio marinus]